MPFPYVVLDGRDDLADAPRRDGAAPSASENERAWFVAHVDLGAPRWVSAREALVKSLAIEEPMATAPAQDDAAWDGGATPLVPLAAAPVAMPSPVISAPAPAMSSAPTEGPSIKLRPKRRAPSLNTNPPMPAPVEPMIGADHAGDSALPLLKEGLAPLVPIPGLALTGAFVAPSPFENVVVARVATPTRQSAGRFKKAVGMVLLCGLLGVAGFLLFQELMPSGERISNAESVVQANVAPVASVSPEAPAPVPVPAVPAVSEPVVEAASVAEAAPAAPAAPAQASPEFANYVAGLRVSGVSLGASPRALINGRMVHLGDLIDPVLAVRLVAVDASSRHLIFEDRSTARVQARY